MFNNWWKWVAVWGPGLVTLKWVFWEEEVAAMIDPQEELDSKNKAKLDYFDIGHIF